MKMLFIYVIAIEILDLIAIFLAKHFSINDKILYAILSAIAFGASGFFFNLSLKYEAATIVNILWIAASAIAATVLTIVYFKEQIAPIQYIAIGIILVGLILLFSKPGAA